MPNFLAFSRAPSQAFLENSRSDQASETVAGFGFCAAATSKTPSVKAGLVLGPDGSIEKYFG